MCVVQNFQGIAESNPATLSVNDPPVITLLPIGGQADPGEPVTFVVEATGTEPLSYQWRKNGTDITDATNTSYAIGAVQESDEGVYDCVATNMADSATSDVAVLSVNDPPTITDHPDSITIDAGKMIGKVNPLIGAAGVSAVPMAARVAQAEGQRANPRNFLLHHAMGPNVAGVIASATVAGLLISFLD